MPEIENGRSTRWLSIIILNILYKDREKIDFIINKLSKANIEARPVWKPMHLQPLYRKNEYFSHTDKLSVSEKLYNFGLCLPSGSNLSDEDQNRVISLIISCLSWLFQCDKNHIDFIPHKLKIERLINKY